MFSFASTIDMLKDSSFTNKIIPHLAYIYIYELRVLFAPIDVAIVWIKNKSASISPKWDIYTATKV